MVWGGAFDEKGSNYIRKLVQAEKTIKFLEKFKEELEQEEKEQLSRTIDIIVNHFSKNTNENVQDDQSF
ncbi:MAG: hypothetical protein EU532_04680 [Promethearchaeota archaeon]|nr:MAG: hypothetical protein EU532_04680 [Candidatus Lokiarchaeota archaeon]